MTDTKRLVRRLLVGGTTTVTLAAGLVVGVAGPASADPVTTLVGKGSDTTQDVVNGIADSIGLGLVGSWDAVDPVTGVQHLRINPKRGCTETRPNGSGQGFTALRQAAVPPVPNPPAPFVDQTDLPEPGCNDFGRSSSGPNPTDPGGRWVYIPFALDAVTVASQHFGDATAANYNALSFDPTNLAAGTGTLQQLYRDQVPVTVNGTTYDPACTVAPCAGGATPIHLYIPQSGSGTRTFWLAQMGNPVNIGLLHDHAFNPATGLFDGAIVEEHDGAVLQGDPLGIGPFSISQWVGQRNGHNDRRHGAHLHSLVNISVNPPVTVNPLTGNFPTVETGNLNTNFIIRREVFNIVDWNRVNPHASDPVHLAEFDPTLLSIFAPAGSGGALCGKSAVILNFGFGLLNATTPHTCGQILTSLRTLPLDNP